MCLEEFTKTFLNYMDRSFKRDGAYALSICEKKERISMLMIRGLERALSKLLCVWTPSSYHDDDYDHYACDDSKEEQEADDPS